jgi:hypothetical protein
MKVSSGKDLIKTYQNHGTLTDQRHGSSAGPHGFAWLDLLQKSVRDHMKESSDKDLIKHLKITAP